MNLASNMKPRQIDYHGYGKGHQRERDSSELTAIFDDKH
jgi:hypothetical protein